MQAPPDATTRHLRILLVEDARAVRDRLVELVSEIQGVELVWAAETLAEARELAVLRPDIALVDLRLPDGSGLELVREIRAGGTQTFIAVLTAFGGAQVREACLAAGADAFLSKNDGLAGLADMLRALVEGGS